MRLSLCVLGLAAVLGCAPDEPGVPNVLLITVDTLRPDHLGCYGYAKPTSPHIDRLCESSVVFEQAVTPTPTTDPGHATIMTALHPSRHGVLRNGWKLADEHTTLAERMKQAGYRTQAFVSVGHLSHENGFGQGFDALDDELETKSISPEEVTDKAVRFVSRTRRPFFLWVHYWDPHGPYAPPEEHDLFFDEEEGRWLRAFTTGGRVPEGDASVVRPGSEARIVSLYDGEIHYTDSQIARLVGALRDREIFDDTLVVLTSDHGEMMDEIAESHGYAFDHGEYLYEANVRVPLIVKLPGSRGAGTRVSALASNMDVMPTVLDALGHVSAQDRFDGVSLLPAMTEGGAHTELVLQRRAPRSQDLAAFHELAVRGERWKYLWDADASASWLYDLADDPNETRDVSDLQADTRARFASELDAWRTEAAPVAHQVVPVEQRAALEALGYIQ